MPVQRIASPSPYAPVIGFSSAVRAGDVVYVSGTTAADTGGVVGGDDPYAQAVEALRKVGVALQTVGSDLSQVVQTRLFLARAEHWEQVGRAHGEVFGEHRPACTMVVVGLLDPAMLVEVEAVAYTGP